MTLIWWVAVDPLAPYELAKLGVPATATAAWELPAWYLAKLWYGVLVKRCRKPEDLNVLHVRLGAAGPNKEQETYVDAWLQPQRQRNAYAFASRRKRRQPNRGPSAADNATMTGHN